MWYGRNIFRPYIAADLTAEQAKAYRIADNKSGEIAEWDMEILPIEISNINYTITTQRLKCYSFRISNFIVVNYLN
jgi:hypothetical protein